MKTHSSHSLEDIWKLYWETEELEYRDLLIEAYLHLVKTVVKRLVAGMPSYVKVEDLYASGVEGLVRAVKRYDPEKSHRFEGYAQFLIKAAIIDDLRKQDWVPRSVYQKANRLSGAIEALRQTLGREPTDDDLCAYLKVSQKELSCLFVSSKPALVISLNEEVLSHVDGDHVLSLEERLADDRAETGYDVIDKQEMVALLKHAIQELDEKEQQVMILYYYDELTLKEIGKILGVSESRISQIHAKALVKLRLFLGNLF